MGACPRRRGTGRERGPERTTGDADERNGVTTMTTHTNANETTLEEDNTPDTTREFSAVDLLQLGLPSECRGGKVLEDRFLDREDEMRRVKSKTTGTTRMRMKTDEYRFVIFQVGEGEIWGIPYTKHESGKTTFDTVTIATLYEYQRLLVQAAA